MIWKALRSTSAIHGKACTISYAQLIMNISCFDFGYWGLRYLLDIYLVKALKMVALRYYSSQLPIPTLAR